MLDTVITADVGSAFTKLAARGRIASEESRAVLDPSDGSCILAVGVRSRSLLNAVPVYPVRNGAVANTAVAAIMLRRFALDLIGRRSLCGVSLRLLMPLCSTELQRLSAAQAAREAGFRRVSAADSMLCGARGAGVEVEGERAVMVADIGRDKLCAAVCANGGSIVQRMHSIGSADFEKCLQAHFACEHGLLLGSRAAELLKRSMHMPTVRAVGKDSESGRASAVTVKASELQSAVEPVYDALCGELTETLNITPPDAAADICDSGIVLIGGGAKQFGLCKAIEKRLKLKVRSADNAECAAVYGASLDRQAAARSCRKAYAAQ